VWLRDFETYVTLTPNLPPGYFLKCTDKGVHIALAGMLATVEGADMNQIENGLDTLPNATFIELMKKLVGHQEDSFISHINSMTIPDLRYSGNQREWLTTLSQLADQDGEAGVGDKYEQVFAKLVDTLWVSIGRLVQSYESSRLKSRVSTTRYSKWQ
jgi:hypothetical protein